MALYKGDSYDCRHAPEGLIHLRFRQGAKSGGVSQGWKRSIRDIPEKFNYSLNTNNIRRIAMNWDAIGAMAEFIAAVLVLPTLIYLAIQFRQNTKAVKSSTYQAINDSMSKNLEDMINNEYLVPLYLKAVEDHSTLSAEEKARFHFLNMVMLRRFEAVFTQRTLGLIPESMTEGYERSFLSYFANSPSKKLWPTIRVGFGTEFAEYIDKHLEKERSSIHSFSD
jgi:hypothetical protein